MMHAVDFVHCTETSHSSPCFNVCCTLQDEIVIPTRRGTLIIKPAQSSLSSEKLATTKAMHLIPEDELAEAEMGKKPEQRSSSLLELVHKSRRDSASDEVEEIDQIKFHELLALNLPDWYLVLLGVICAALLGALFPLKAIILSGFLVVSLYSTSLNIFLVHMCFCWENNT